MDTNRLKKFAAEARRTLLQGVAQRLTALGFRDDGTTDEKPELMGGGAVYMGKVYSEDFYHKWMSLYDRMQSHSYREVVEEAAYTWFNRLVAIRIMAKNDLVSPVLEYESDEVRIPVIVTEARQGRLPQMSEENRRKLEALLQNDALTDEQFALLIVAYCHCNPIINKCFGSISDYTELLLPVNILKTGGFVDSLNDDDYLSEDDYHSPELIGWLYQFYISERKDEVFAKKGKYTADEIPAATQIFTPNWIVKYMVQNTVGRIYLDNNPYSDEIKKSMDYLVEPSEPTPADAKFQFDDIHDLTCADLSCGSGHILNECFDLLYQLYIEEGYNRRKAVEDIFRYNLTGVDIDTRARQLATFALLMKACSKDASFADAHCMPRVLDMPEPYTHKHDLEDVLPHFFMGCNQEMMKEVTDALTLMDHADTLGSIMKFKISERTRNAIAVRMDEYRAEEHLPEPIRALMPYMEVILALTEKYAALVMNPPYMGGGNMNAVLSDYVKTNYPKGKSDLATVFVEMMSKRTIKDGRYAFIIPPSWMFLSTFESLRKSIIENQKIDSLLHLSRGVFGADFGASSAVIANTKDEGAKGTYFRLIERTFQEFDQKHLRILFEKTLANHDFRYRFADYSKDVEDIVYSEDGAKIYYSNVAQNKFEKIPGCPIGYWVSEKMMEAFRYLELNKICETRCGMASGRNDYYLRLWFEISRSNFALRCESREKSIESHKKWFPYDKAGEYRKWFGNRDYVINWLNDGEELQNTMHPDGKRIWAHNFNLDKIFKKHIGWSDVISGEGGLSFRFFEEGFLFDGSSNAIYEKRGHGESEFMEILAYSNSKVPEFIRPLLNPTIHFKPGNYLSLPYKSTKNISLIKLSKQNISISKQDWDAHETSWDFAANELVDIERLTKVALWDDESGTFSVQNNNFCKSKEALSEGRSISIADRLELYKAKWTHLLMQLHKNEEELNREFIHIYGLEDELTPDVPLNEVTILQQGEISINEANEIVWHDDVIIKQLISYAVGCMMGRYSIDKPGLILANQGDGIEQYKQLVPNSRFEIDDDGIIPLMSINPELADNAAQRFKAWLSTAFGEDKLVENLNLVETAIGKRIEDYFAKVFWKDHKKMYQNRPIYWLFSSKKGAFQCLVYMHRMNAYTAERVRTGYLLPHIEWLIARQQEMQANAANLSARERREMDNIGKQIAECREYHDRLHEVADKQIAFDLDDGVVVNYAKFGNVLAKLK